MLKQFATCLFHANMCSVLRVNVYKRHTKLMNVMEGFIDRHFPYWVCTGQAVFDSTGVMYNSPDCIDIYIAAELVSMRREMGAKFVHDNNSDLFCAYINAVMCEIMCRYARSGISEAASYPFRYAPVEYSSNYKRPAIVHRIFYNRYRPLTLVFMAVIVPCRIEDMPVEQLMVWWGYQVMQEIELDTMKFFTLGFGNQICVSCSKLAARKRELQVSRKSASMKKCWTICMHGT